MLACQAANVDGAYQSGTLFGVNDLTISMWLATTSADVGVVFGGLDRVGGGEVGLAIAIHMDNGGSSLLGGDVLDYHIALRLAVVDGGLKLLLAQANAPALFDGQLHHLIVARSSEFVSMWLDGAPLSVSVGTISMGSLPVPAVTCGIGGCYDSFQLPPLGLPSECTVGEVAVWHSALSNDGMAALAAGASADMISVPPVAYWRMLGGALGRPETGDDVLTVQGTEAAVEPRVFWGSGPSVGNEPDLRRHTELYLSPGVPAVVGVDAPVARVPGGVAAVDMAGLSLLPSTVYCVTGAARNETGRSSERRALLLTDAGGEPQSVPTPVSGVSVTAIAGGVLLVRWEYVEVGSTVANEFVIEIRPRFVDGAPVAPSPVVVPRAESAASFIAQVGPLASGVYEIRVLSRSVSGAAVEAVPGVLVRADATPPASIGVPLEAVAG